MEPFQLVHIVGPTFCLELPTSLSSEVCRVLEVWIIWTLIRQIYIAPVMWEYSHWNTWVYKKTECNFCMLQQHSQDTGEIPCRSCSGWTNFRLLLPGLRLHGGYAKWWRYSTRWGFFQSGSYSHPCSWKIYEYKWHKQQTTYWVQWKWPDVYVLQLCQVVEGVNEALDISSTVLTCSFRHMQHFPTLEWLTLTPAHEISVSVSCEHGAKSKKT